MSELAPSRDVILSMSGVSKHFGGVRALTEVDLTLQSGEVRALVGANGSGKSTLVKILAGYHEPEPGATIKIRGRTEKFAELSKAQRRLGIGMVHQDLGLIGDMSVLENFLLPDFASSLEWYVDWKTKRRNAAQFLERFGVGQLNTYVAALPRVTRALLALGRAVHILESSADGASRRGVLVLDEITAFLSASEVQVLHEVVRQTADSGHAVLFISHDLGEVLSFADTAMVLRDGRLVGERMVDDTDVDDLFELIVGRKREEVVPDIASTPDRPHAVRIESAGILGSGLSSFDVAPGEVVGLTGLLGSGFEEIPYVLFGARKDSVGRLTLDGEEIPLHHLRTRKAMSKGIALVPGDRLGAGIIGSLTIAENIATLQLRRFSRRGWLSWRKVRAYADDVISRYRIVAYSAGETVLTLSGGNQQRVLLAKWLETHAKLLLLHDPVQGVDVAARIEIARLIRIQAKEGLAVICASSDYEILSDVCDQVLVYRNGEVVDRLTRGADPTIARERIEWSCLNRGATTLVIEDGLSPAAEG